jgi:serine/threonine protein kinase
VSPARSEPPILVGYTYQRWLGGGGFADVFLYRQTRPDREVAVKVLRNTAEDEDARRRFDAEADLMARVSAHPYIATIFGADVAGDGRPFLVMEYYPHGNYGVEARNGMGVTEVLRAGVQVASAVETAHRAGILHRDIKAANVLISEFRRPALTDFGIAGAGGDGADSSGGVSVPYASPEVLIGGASTVQSDVYSLGATVYLLLAARTPFEVPGHNQDKELVGRILNSTPPPTGRSDAPGSLEHLLHQALAKDPDSRPSSAAAFAHALQDIERELQLAPTAFEVRIDDPVAPERRPDDEDRTRASAVRTVRPTGPTPAALAPPTPVPQSPSRQPTAGLRPWEQSAPAARPTSGSDPQTGRLVEERETLARRYDYPPAGTALKQGEAGPPVGGSGPQAVAEPDTRARAHRPGSDDTIRRGPVVRSAPTSSEMAAPGADKRRFMIMGAAAMVVVVAAVAAVLLLRSSPSNKQTADSQGSRNTSGPTTTAPPLVPDPTAPTDIRVTVKAGVAQITWSAPGALKGDIYRVLRVDPGHTNGPFTQVRGLAATVKGIGSGQTPCFEVATVRDDQISDPSSPTCANQ